MSAISIEYRIGCLSPPPLPLSTISFRIVPFPTSFPFSPSPFRLQFRPHVADVENEFSYQNAIW